MSDRRLWDLAGRQDWPAVHALLDASSDEVKEQFFAFLVKGGWTAIHWCAVCGAPAETVHALLQAGPRGYVNVKTNGGRTPAMIATWNGHADVLRQLINDGADLSIINHYRNTARSLAVQYNHTNCIAILDDYAAAATFFMCLKRYDDFHIRQSLGRRSHQLHPRILELAGSDERLVSNWTPTGEGLAQPEVSGIFLHHLHGREEGLSRHIAEYIFGPKDAESKNPDVDDYVEEGDY